MLIQAKYAIIRGRHTKRTVIGVQVLGNKLPWIHTLRHSGDNQLDDAFDRAKSLHNLRGEVCAQTVSVSARNAAVRFANCTCGTLPYMRRPRLPDPQQR
jgi:hypothetical protein